MQQLNLDIYAKSLLLFTPMTNLQNSTSHTNLSSAKKAMSRQNNCCKLKSTCATLKRCTKNIARYHLCGILRDLLCIKCLKRMSFSRRCLSAIQFRSTCAKVTFFNLHLWPWLPYVALRYLRPILCAVWIHWLIGRQLILTKVNPNRTS